MPIEPKDSYSDEELGQVDLAALLAEGIRTPDGRLSGDLQGAGSVAGAVQLEAGGVSVEDLKAGIDALRAGGRPDGPPALASLVDAGLAAAGDDPDDRKFFVRWLGQVLMLMTMRARARGGS
jgi:hypothetical protein